MVSGDSPAVARRRLRIALRARREAAELTQGDVAAALDWSLSKVQRIESGDVTISGTDLRALLELLAVADLSVVDRFVADAKAARRRGPWDEARYRANLTPAMIKLLEFEGQASAIRVYSPGLVPGLLQTRRHAEAVLAYWNRQRGGNGITHEQRAVRLEVRLRRHEHIFNAGQPPYLLILDESVLHREVGGPDVTVEQLQHLLRCVSDGKVTLRVVPFTAGVSATMIGGFTLLSLDTEDDVILYREIVNTDEIVQDDEIVAWHRDIFDTTLAQTCSEEKSIHLVKARVALLLARLAQ
ncbi:helix-turn-helix transcriptional regulator [Catellatospora sp. NPDC049111]|uniref:helix-turn-helix domain-containing protein n=1 Tax=Catellatospora sp. NPDC049111 TaxID=3155271 RepID=UPI0033CF83E3